MASSLQRVDRVAALSFTRCCIQNHGQIQWRGNLHRQNHRHNGERVGLKRDDVGCRHEWLSDSDGCRLDDLRILPHARVERAFDRNDSVLGARDGALKKIQRSVVWCFGRDYPREMSYHIQHVRGGNNGHYNDRGGDRGDSDEPNRHTDRNSDRGRDRVRDSYRDRYYTLTQSLSKEFNIELNTQIMRISDMRELRGFISTHSVSWNHVNVATVFHKILQVSQGVGERFVRHTLDTLEKVAIRFMETFHHVQISNILHIIDKKKYKTCLLPELE